MVKRFRRGSLAPLPLADSQDPGTSATGQPLLDAPAPTADETAMPRSPCMAQPFRLLPSFAKTVPPRDLACQDYHSSQPLRAPQFAPVRPFLRWGLQSQPASTLRPKLSSSMQLRGLPPPCPSGRRQGRLLPCVACRRRRLCPRLAAAGWRCNLAGAATIIGSRSTCALQANPKALKLSPSSLPPPPKARKLRPTTTRMLIESKREDLRQLFFLILHRVEHDCNRQGQGHWWQVAAARAQTGQDRDARPARAACQPSHTPRQQTRCLRFNKGRCTDKRCKFAHLCAVRLPNGQACGQRHPATQHKHKPSDKAPADPPPQGPHLTGPRGGWRSHLSGCL